MPLDDLLRDSLHDDADRRSSPALWADVRTRGNQIRHRRNIGRGATALVTIVALVVGVVALTRGDGADSSIAITPAPGESTEVAAVVGHNRNGDRLVVLDATDGHEVRTLTEGVGVTNGGIAVTPDGATAYYTRIRQALPCSVSEITRVPVDGSAEPEVVVSPGSNPVLSPDGSTLAYSRPPAAAGQCDTFGAVGFHELATGSERRLDVGPTVQPWTWSPDGARLLVATTDGEPVAVALNLVNVSDLSTTPLLEYRSPTDDATYLPDGRLAIAFVDEETSRRRIVILDATGEPMGALFDAEPIGVTRVSADAAGQVLLHVGGDTLQRWHPGDAAPTTIAEDVRDAAWIPKA